MSKDTKNLAVMIAGGRGRGRSSTITHDGETRTVADWASGFGLTVDGLMHRIESWGLEAAMRGERPAAEPKAKTGRPSASEGDLSDLKMAASSLANAVRDMANAPREYDWQAHAHLSYRFLRGVLRRNRFPLDEAE